MAWTYQIAQAVPPDRGEKPSLGASRIRQAKQSLCERLAGLIYGCRADDSESDDTKRGFWKLPLNKLESAPNSEAEKGIVYTKVVDDITELFYKDDDGNEVKITTKGKLGDADLDAVFKSVTVGETNILDKIYPIGSIYTNAAVNTNPATLLGFGTWVAFGEGRVLLGNGDGYAAGETGGAKTVNLSHTHEFTSAWPSTATPRSPEQLVVGRTGLTQISDAWTPSGNKTTLSSGSTTQNIINPYIVVYMWRRTA